MFSFWPGDEGGEDAGEGYADVEGRASVDDAGLEGVGLWEGGEVDE